MTDYGGLLKQLNQFDVRFIVIGGLAAMSHGSSRFTKDVDVVYDRDEENLERIVAALRPIHPYLRGAPPGLPFRFDVPTLQAGLNFTLVTDLGEIDFLGEVAGGGRYENLVEQTVQFELFGERCMCVSLPMLIRLKQAAGRPKDFEAIAELESLWDEIHAPEKSREQYPDSPHHRDLSSPDEHHKDVDPTP